MMTNFLISEFSLMALTAELKIFVAAITVDCLLSSNFTGVFCSLFSTCQDPVCRMRYSGLFNATSLDTISGRNSVHFPALVLAIFSKLKSRPVALSTSLLSIRSRASLR